MTTPATRKFATPETRPVTQELPGLGQGFRRLGGLLQQEPSPGVRFEVVPDLAQGLGHLLGQLRGLNGQAVRQQPAEAASQQGEDGHDDGQRPAMGNSRPPAQPTAEGRQENGEQHSRESQQQDVPPAPHQVGEGQNQHRHHNPPGEDRRADAGRGGYRIPPTRLG